MSCLSMLNVRSRGREALGVQYQIATIEVLFWGFFFNPGQPLYLPDEPHMCTLWASHAVLILMQKVPDLLCPITWHRCTRDTYTMIENGSCHKPFPHGQNILLYLTCIRTVTLRSEDTLWQFTLETTAGTSFGWNNRLFFGWTACCPSQVGSFFSWTLHFLSYPCRNLQQS